MLAILECRSHKSHLANKKACVELALKARTSAQSSPALRVIPLKPDRLQRDEKSASASVQKILIIMRTTV
jgi:hypothetical protein